MRILYLLPLFLTLITLPIHLPAQMESTSPFDSMYQHAQNTYNGIELLKYYQDTLVRKRRAFSKAYARVGDELIATADAFGSDSSRYFLRETVAEAYMFDNDYDAARPYIEEALQIGQNAKDTFIIYKSTYLLSYLNIRASNYDTSLAYAREALPFALALLPRQKLPAFYVYQGIGNSNTYLGNIDTAVFYYLKAQHIAEGVPELAENLIGLRINLGTARFTAEDYDGAIETYTKVLSTLPEDYPPYYKVYLIGNLGQAFQENQQSDSARYYAELLYSMADEEQETLNSYYTLSSNIYEQQDSLAQARAHGILAVETARKINNQHALGTSLGSLGRIERRLGNYSQAERLFNEAEPLLLKSGARDQLKGLRLAQVENYLEQNAPKVKAYFDEFINLNDSIESLAVKEAISELETRYQTRLRQDSITNLTLRSQAAETAATNRQKQLWLVLALLAAVGGGLIFAIRESNRRKALNNELGQKNARITLLNSDINHRTSHYLTSIIKLLREQQYKMEEAGADTGTLVALERQTLVYTKLQGLLKTVNDRTVVELDDYLGKLTDMLQESFQGAGDPLQLQLQVDTVVVDPSVAAPLALILNELLTNTVKYAKRCGGIIHASFRCEQVKDGELLVNYEDDGPDESLDTSDRFSSNSGLELIEGLTRQLEAEREVVEGYDYRARVDL